MFWDASPTSIQLAQPQVSRFTVADAYTRQAAEGFVAGHRRGGAIVTGTRGTDVPDPRRSAAALRARPRVAAIRPYVDQPFADRPRFDMRPGNVDANLLPLRACRRTTTAALGAPPPRYGEPLGDPALRAALAHWIGRTRGAVCTGDDIVVTSGALHDLVARALVEPGDIAAVEEPGYPPAVELLRGLGLHVAGVPVDDQGLVVDALPDAARLVYVTPSHQFPLGSVLSRARRRALLRWATAHDAAVVEDD